MISSSDFSIADRLLYVCRISPALPTRLVSVSGIRVRRVLERGRIHRTVFLCPHAAFFIFHNSLVRKAPDKKLVLRHVFKICSAQMQQTAAVCEKCLDTGVLALDIFVPPSVFPSILIKSLQDTSVPCFQLCQSQFISTPAGCPSRTAFPTPLMSSNCHELFSLFFKSKACNPAYLRWADDK